MALAVRLLLIAGIAFAQSDGIPVNDPLVKSKCGACHAGDERGNMQHVSFARGTPEGWQNVLRRMILAKGLMVTQPEARAIVKYLSDSHGLSPAEAEPVLYEPERRIRTETVIPSQSLRTECARCHTFARVLSWRRTAGEWKYFVTAHAAEYKIAYSEDAVAFLSKAAPLQSQEWDAWKAHAGGQPLTGRWLVSARLPGHGDYTGEMQVDAAGANGDFNTRVTLRSTADGTTITRTGTGLIYGGAAWRGRSKGTPGGAPDDPASEAREVLLLSPDQSIAEGRWFWGQYQEFGFDVKLRRATAGAGLLVVDRRSLRVGTKNNRVRLTGDNFPAQVRPKDLSFGAGIAVKRITSRTATDVVAEVDVAADATLGRRDITFRGSSLPGAIAVYDRVDYVDVMPASALAGFGNAKRGRGYQQFEAIGFQRGPDGRLHTADDLNLGPADVAWALELFYETDPAKTNVAGTISPTGLFAPSANNPNNNFDLFVIATAKTEKSSDGEPLVGKASLVVTVPAYTFNGRQYVRDLDRWVDNGPAPADEVKR